MQWTCCHDHPVALFYTPCLVYTLHTSHCISSRRMFLIIVHCPFIWRTITIHDRPRMMGDLTFIFLRYLFFMHSAWHQSLAR